MRGSRRYILALPIISIFIGGMVLLYGYWEHTNDIDEIKLLFDAHVDSVATVVEEGAREAAISTAFLYELAEEEALTSIRHLTQSEYSPAAKIDLPAEEHWRIQLLIGEDGQAEGVWGSIPADERGEFIRHMQNAPRDELLDDILTRKLGFFCISRNLKNALAVICRDAEWLSDLRKEVGIGPLLKGIIKKDVMYVALQDSSGILAVAPSLDMISAWSDDSALESALLGNSKFGASRLRKIENRTIFEGLIPFKMADESTVLLRVGIDALVLKKLETNAHRRYGLMLVLILGINVLVVILTGVLWKWQNKKEDIENLLNLREDEKKHWETVGQLAATVAHEVRNPLSTMKMISQRLSREFKVVGDTEQQEFAEMLEMLETESDRVNRVVTEFLDLGKPLNLNFQSTEINAAIEEATWPLNVRGEKEGKDLVLEPGRNHTLVLDPERFKQLLVNVVENGLDAVEEGGKVTMKTELIKNKVKVLVIDNGPGLSEENLLEVMKPFVSFKSNGTGLGLPLVKRLTEAHGGSFELTSKLGEGTTAHIVLPLEMENPDA